MFLLKILVSSFAVIIAQYLIPGVSVDGFLTAVLVAFVLAVLNAFLKPIIIVLTIPITLFTFGLFLVVINAFMVLITAHFVDGFRVDGFWWALLFSIILSLVTFVLEGINKQSEKRQRRQY